MEEVSFATSVKESVSALAVKPVCCRISMLYGMLWFAVKRAEDTIVLNFDDEEGAALCERLLLETLECECDIEYYKNGFRLYITDRRSLDTLYGKFGDFTALRDKLFRCEGCHRHFMRGAFLCAGTINAPDAEYHLELHSRYPLEPVVSVFNTSGIFPHISRRGESNVLYVKNSEEISDFLQCIGARNAAFSLINEKILREIRNNANRQKNFDTANINRSVRANAVQNDAVKYIISSNLLAKLTPQLRETARLRYENPALSLSDLAGLHEPPISKSGLTHRLRAIVEFASEFKNKESK